MKALMCSLAVVLSVALGSAVFAGSEKYLHMTGTVVKPDPGMAPGVIVIETAPKKYVTFHAEAEGAGLKVGEKVTVYYDPSKADHHGFWFAMKIEKVGKAEGGSKKN
jgi:hypothetical protein